MIDQNPERYIGGQLIVYGGIPFNLCLGISSPDVGDNALGRRRYRPAATPRPIFAGDTVFAATEMRAKRDFPGAPTSASSTLILRGHKFEREGRRAGQKVEIFYLERELVVKRREFYV